MSEMERLDRGMQTHKQELYLKVTSLHQGSMKVEEYIREFEQLQIRCALREESEQTIVRFLKGLNSAILERVELQPFWTFEDTCKLVVNVEKQLKSRRPYSTTPSKPAVPVKTFHSHEPELAPKDDRDKGKAKEISKDIPKSQKKCFKWHGYGHFQADCPNRRVLTIKGIEELDHIEVEKDEEEDSLEEGETSYLPHKEGEMLMIRRVLHATEAPPTVS